MKQRVSVLITCYNYGRYLGQCLESVVAQTRPPDEIIVVDDGSEDNTPEVARSFPQVGYFRQKNGGYAAASNRAVKESTGDILCHLDADDFLLPAKLERVMEVFDGNPGIGGVMHDVVHVDGAGKSFVPAYATSSSTPELYTIENTQACGFLYRLPQRKDHIFGNPTTITTRRDAVVDMFPVPEGPAFAVDAVFLAGALRSGVYYLPEVLAAYRHHGSNLWTGNPAGDWQIIRMWEYLAAHPPFRQKMTPLHRDILRASILEHTAFIASRTGEGKLDGALSAMRIPLLTLKHGLLCNWKHLALPLICVLPVKRSPRNAAPAKTGA